MCAEIQRHWSLLPWLCFHLMVRTVFDLLEDVSSPSLKKFALVAVQAVFALLEKVISLLLLVVVIIIVIINCDVFVVYTPAQ